MSLLEALAEAVVNVSAAKGGRVARTGQGNNDGLLGQQPSGSGGSLEDLLGSVLGGQGQRPSSGGRAQDGLGGLLEQLTQGSSGKGGSGGLDDLLGQLTGASGSQGGGGLGQIIGAVTNAISQSGNSGDAGSGSFGDLLNQAISNRGKSVERPKPSVAQEAGAGLMLRAMIQAAKSDGKFDQAEQDKLLGCLGDVSSMERKFVNNELAKPLDVGGLARDVPRGLEHQVYAMSVMGIDLDNKNEANYLHELAQALGIDQRSVNAVHAKVGAPALYR